MTLKVHMHCEACAQGLKKRIRRMKGKRKTQMGSNRVDQFSVENVMGFQGRMIFLLFPHFPQVNGGRAGVLMDWTNWAEPRVWALSFSILLGCGSEIWASFSICDGL